MIAEVSQESEPPANGRRAGEPLAVDRRLRSLRQAAKTVYSGKAERAVSPDRNTTVTGATLMIGRRARSFRDPEIDAP